MEWMDATICHKHVLPSHDVREENKHHSFIKRNKERWPTFIIHIHPTCRHAINTSWRGCPKREIAGPNPKKRVSIDASLFFCRRFTIFSKGNGGEFPWVEGNHHKYCKAYRQMINNAKSNMVFNKWADEERCRAIEKELLWFSRHLIYSYIPIDRPTSYIHPVHEQTLWLFNWFIEVCLVGPVLNTNWCNLPNERSQYITPDQYLSTYIWSPDIKYTKLFLILHSNQQVFQI